MNYSLILVGSFILAIGVVGFLAPNKIATGGTAGLAIVFHHIFNLPIGVLMALINIPLLLVSIKYLGKKFAFKSMFSIGLIVLFVDLLQEVILLPNFSDDLLLATLYGGITIGIGLGLVFKGGGSAGGGTILAKIITSKFNVKTGDVILVLDGVVVVLAGFVFKSTELALWSMISIFATSKLIDIVLTGKSNQKIVHISSFKNLEKLSEKISQSIGVEGTIINGSNFTQTEKKDILFIIIDKNMINALGNLLTNYDVNARMIVMDATVIKGEQSI
ncbi:MAG: YitT family protein [Flavobacteriales bacterium]|nr:YitT family protein [Flavobacteriales bacterium]